MKLRYRLVPVSFTLLLFTLLSACKIQIDVPMGGNVYGFDYDVIYDIFSESKRCNVEVDNFSTVETFFAEPSEGYVFVEWARGDRHLFGGETEGVLIDSSQALGHPALEKIIKSDETYYLRPVFALEGYDTNPIGVPALYQIDCDGCEGPQRLQWPVSMDYQRDLDLPAVRNYAEDHSTLGKFILYANDYDYKIVNLRVMDDNNEGIASISGLREGQVVRKGEQVIFSLVTNAPASRWGINTVVFDFGFDIAGTTAEFDARVSSVVGD